ncbi:ribosomal protection-like ABC-F family protein [Lacrimispora sphenoides]|uniref:Lincosamide and streptogramin A transport system ATP-binding/permease protein n=1 Tax=Lacrimispora sphenoides JCM 1415 TaxID=1297793 RepID=A0ABY1C6R2_9FIRM|nr:ABC-F type ribosomal protection protein [Lacrimispora sphenoides]SET74895.1 lincosamide and streptogramin A transport system ATP-binding/permease protein [[Clostridium] sphenoides JCM 1415]SUY50968.1 ABC transporter [Lacrimispora sphenoides]
MSLIQVTDLSFTYEGSPDPVFEHVSFQIDTDWKLGFTGRNGRGKTTFLNLLMNRYNYTGTIISNVMFDYFPFPVPDEELDTLEILNSILGEYPFWELQRELSKLKVSEDVLYRPYYTLSNGERTKVLLAALFLREGHFLLIDEPTNHLDREARELVSQYLNSKKGFILVSHDRKFLDASVDHILSINKTSIEVQRGNFTSWYENKQMQDQYERSENERLKKDIRHLEAAARQSGEWADQVESTKIGKKSMNREKSIDTRAYVGEKSRRMQMRRKNLENRQNHAIENKKGLLKNIEEAEDLKLYPLKYRSSRILSLKDVVPYYEGPVCKPVSFTLEQEQRISLQGKNGCGKSSILKLVVGSDLTGENISFEGHMELSSGIKISYVSQDTSFLKGSLTEYSRENGIEDSLFKALLRKLDFSREQLEKPMESYSEGQKKKVLIARSLCEQAHLYIWDEPLNFIDVYSRIQIEDLILKFQPTMLLVEHDDAFTRKVATGAVEL